MVVPAEVNDMPFLTTNVFVNCKTSGMDQFLKRVCLSIVGSVPVLALLNCCPGGIVPEESKIYFSSFSSFGL